MEICQNIEEKILNGERQLIFHYESKTLSLNENSLLGLLMQFGSLSCLKDFFSKYKYDDTERYFRKYKIIYEIG